MGKYKQQLEQELSTYLGVKNTVLFSSCRNTLYTLLLSLKLKKKDEVIIQSFICDSLPMAIEKAGATAIKVEVDPDTFNLSTNLVEKKINNNTKVIIFVHTYGNPTGITEIKALCEKHKLILIEDIAHALGASFNGQLAGTFGDYAVYSLTKQMVNIGGGALLTNNNVYEVKLIRDRNRQKPAWLDYPKRLIASLYETRAFFLSKLVIDYVRKKADLKLANALSPHFYCTDIEAYLALHQLSSIKNKMARRKENYRLLKNILLNDLIVQNINEEAHSSYNYLSLIFPDEEQRDLAVKKHFLFLPPWPGSKISKKIIFIPNNPNFNRKKIDSFAQAYIKSQSLYAEAEEVKLYKSKTNKLRSQNKDCER
ncbi:aminotransferase class I/II-fold pyridoxal phosphate-dependent enzyme [Candidatus Woesearchaeota archaeon]|nr:aminotransferase class I/II-fold pyridoxal phosphate-dependent enzyme [Candidatus Woesearchaeota archaeon]